MNHTRDIPQTFWRDDRLPWLELRSTWRSRQAYKRHSHPQLSVGAIIEGETRCLCNGEEYLLQPGDLIVIPPHASHSCNPLHDRPRSYHMLYLEAAWCHAQRPDIPPGASIASPQPLLRDSPLFACFQQVVALMSRGSLEQLPARLAQLLHAPPRRRRHITPAPCCFSAWRQICQRRRRWISWPTTARFVKRPLSAP